MVESIISNHEEARMNIQNAKNAEFFDQEKNEFNAISRSSDEQKKPIEESKSAIHYDSNRANMKSLAQNQMGKKTQNTNKHILSTTEGISKWSHNEKRRFFTIRSDSRNKKAKNKSVSRLTEKINSEQY